MTYQQQHRVFKPVILFHDHSFSTYPSGVTHRVHIPYGDTPLIQKKKQKVGLMLQSNGKAWFDIIQNSRTPPPIIKRRRTTTNNNVDSHRSILQHDSSNQYHNSSSSSSDTESMTSSSSSSNNSDSSMTPIPSNNNNNNNNNTNMITRKRRGNLPKSVTAVLKQWLIDHCRNPYPTEVEKTTLKDKTGLTLNQISNWFINARRRLLPQILDTIHPNHIEHSIDDPLPTTNKKRKRSSANKNNYYYGGKEEEEDDDLIALEPQTTVVRRRRRYNKKSLINSITTSTTATTAN